jgi:hypothetical protein
VGPDAPPIGRKVFPITAGTYHGLAGLRLSHVIRNVFARARIVFGGGAGFKPQFHLAFACRCCWSTPSTDPPPAPNLGRIPKPMYGSWRFQIASLSWRADRYGRAWKSPLTLIVLFLNFHDYSKVLSIDNGVGGVWCDQPTASLTACPLILSQPNPVCNQKAIIFRTNILKLYPISLLCRHSS